MPEITKRLDRAELGKRVERAEKLLQKGKTAEALEEYLLVLRDDPENDVVRQLAADLCLSLSRNADAVKLLGDLFERQVGAGDATRASLTYKKLARHGSPTWQQKYRFGQLLEGSNKKLAVGTYEAALLDLVKLGKKKETAEVLDRVVALEPTQANLLRVAELASELGNRKVAAASFQKDCAFGCGRGRRCSSVVRAGLSGRCVRSGIALAYGKSLLAQGQVGAAIFILEPQMNSGQVTAGLRETYADALVAAGRHAEAEPLVWQLFEQNPARVQQVIALIGNLLDGEQEDAAVALARKLEQFQRRRGERRQFIAIMEDITAAHRASSQMLEFLSELYNASNRENDYCQTLLKLFDLYCSTGEFAKAAECLDRAAEVDPYEPGHLKRLEMLKGKVEEPKFRAIAARFSSASKAPEVPAHDEGPTLGRVDATGSDAAGGDPGAVRDAEQGGGAAAKNSGIVSARGRKKRGLAAAVSVGGRDAAVCGIGSVASGGGSSRACSWQLQWRAAAPVPDPTTDVRSFTRVAEISRKLYHQGTAPAVLSTAVKEIATHWEATRCIAAMGKAGSSPTAVEEYCAEGSKKAGGAAIAELIACLHKAVDGHDPLAIEDAQKAVSLQAARKAVTEMGAASVLAIPLSDGEEIVGMLVLVHNRPRAWQQADMVVLKTLAEQMVIALNNAGLRRLVKNLSVTDEKSGLLKRASYIDLLLAESKRAIQNASALSVLSAAVREERGHDEGIWRGGRATADGEGGTDLCREYPVE